MSAQITITLPDEIYQRAKQFVRLANRDIASVLADTLQLSMPFVSAEAIDIEPISDIQALMQIYQEGTIKKSDSAQ